MGRTGLLALLAVAASLGQTEPQRTPTEIIGDITHQSDGPEKLGPYEVRVIRFGCGRFLAEQRDQRSLANSLVQMGSTALPTLEEALNSIEKLGEDSPFAVNGHASWLLLAYAKIRGPQAVPVLRTMIDNPKVAYFDVFGLDQGITLALGLTSYVSSIREKGFGHDCRDPKSNTSTLSETPCKIPWQEKPMETLHCDRREEPRDALDKLIITWAGENEVLLEDRLGPNAKQALQVFHKKRNWNRVQSALWNGRHPQEFSVGYRLLVPGRWSRPDETLEEKRSTGEMDVDYVAPEITTQFVDAAGEVCGQRRIRFTATMSAPGVPEKYFIDDANIVDIQRLLAECAKQSPRTRAD